MPSNEVPHTAVHSAGRGLLRGFRSEIALVVAVLAVFGVTLLFNDSYWLDPEFNFKELLRQTSLLGIFALGAAIVIISGGIDLSAGSVIAFSGAICAQVMLVLAPLDELGDPVTKDIGNGVMLLAIGAAVLTGLAIGTFHAWLITVIKLPPFVATLASLVGLRSLAKVMNQEINKWVGGESALINILDPTFYALGDIWWIPLLIFLVLSLLAWVLMSRTVLGRHLYAMGGNEQAARLSGIRTDRLKWFAYCAGSVTAAIAGVLYTAEGTGSDPQTQGRGYELNAIAAAVVGGCSLQGGIGTIQGVMLGVLFLRVVMDAVTKVVGAGSDDYEGLIVGCLVVLAVAFSELRTSTANARKEFFPGLLGLLTIPILAVLLCTVTAVMISWNTGLQVGAVVLAVLGTMKFFEWRRKRKLAQA
ncbi:MAG: ABC transporter permease [Planctomycetota bacterium]|nr:ABC transporter permease [Planctomycetota bacterium]